MTALPLEKSNPSMSVKSHGAPCAQFPVTLASGNAPAGTNGEAKIGAGNPRVDVRSAAGRLMAPFPPAPAGEAARPARPTKDAAVAPVRPTTVLIFTMSLPCFGCTVPPRGRSATDTTTANRELHRLRPGATRTEPLNFGPPLERILR